MTSTITATTLIELSDTVPALYSGMRLDQAAADLFPDYSRARLQSWIKSGDLTVDGRVAKPNFKLVGGESLEIVAKIEPQDAWAPEYIPLDIVFEDETILVINKVADMVVHPAAGNWSGTIMNGLLHYSPSLAQVPRAGIVHRLDKDTTGLMVVAKTIPAQTHLVSQLQEKSVYREYFALVQGELPSSGKVDLPMGRHPSVRTKMAVVSTGGKPAVTHYQCLERFCGMSAVKLNLETGRTHQIRVHMAHLGHPLLGDPVYGKPINNKQIKSFPVLENASVFSRQALHARKLGLTHPVTGDAMEFTAQLPQDLDNLYQILRAES